MTRASPAPLRAVPLLIALVANGVLVAAATPASALTDVAPSLNIEKRASADHINAGEVAAFTITIWNEPGAGDALDVVFEDELPAGLDWQWAVVSEHEPENCSSSGTEQGTLSISCTFAVLSPSVMADGIVIDVWAETDGSVCGVLANTASADASNHLGDELSATDSLIVGCPTLVIDKAADAEVITISGPSGAHIATPSVITWTLTYTMTDGPVTNAVITDEIPTGLSYVAGTASDGGQLVGGILTWSFPTLAASGSVTFQTAVDVETISRSAPSVSVARIVSDQTAEDEGTDELSVVVDAPVLGGTPTPRSAVPDTAIGYGLEGRPMTLPLELLAVPFIGSLGAVAFSLVRVNRERRR